MYLRHAERQGWRSEVLSSNESDLGGYKELVVRIEGDGVYGRLKFESGGHRVQRVPATEAQGRIHTSACTVAVMPEPDEAEAITLNPADLRIDTFRASGRRPAHQQDRLRRARRPSAHRHRGRMPGRPQPAQQQGQGPAGAAGASRRRSAANAPPRRPPPARA